MKPINTSLSPHPEAIKLKRRYGLFYGIFVGSLFAIATWGMDGYMLYQSHGLQAWLKFLVGLFLCVSVGGIAGGLSARLDKIIFAFILWAIASLVFAWLVIKLPTQITPHLIEYTVPETQGLLHYTYYEAFNMPMQVTSIWLLICFSIISVLQLPLSESAIFSTSFGGKIKPIIILALILIPCGISVDDVINEPLRSASIAMDETLQFYITHQGQEIDSDKARLMHLASLRGIQELVTPDYRLVVSGYDEYLGNIQILVKFETSWVDCTVVYNQPVICKEVTTGN